MQDGLQLITQVSPTNKTQHAVYMHLTGYG